MGLKDWFLQLIGTPSDQEIAAAVEGRLQESFGEDVRHLDVAVSDRQVVLSGHCRDIAIKQRAMTEALSVTGVRGVVNNVRVDL